MKVLKLAEKQAKKLVPDHWRKYFRASRYEVKMQRLSPVDLVVHIGAHWAEDAAIYEGYGAKSVLWVEADPATYTKLCQVVTSRNSATRHLTECALVSAETGEELKFHRFNNDGSSSSIHTATDTYKTRFPHSRQTGEVLEMTTKSLPGILAGQGIDPTSADRAMLVLDVQGHELSILQGLGDGLRQFELCKCEVSRVPMYEGGASFDDIDAHFRAQGFKLISHLYSMVPRHGDALYLRQ
ncbi:FkbM family methyltransferase [Pseudophaeobacter sp.]|uniref:FkbM family methyltransferase n=1 Tax=Pseudophaeobacter sp. TaxID=1971739 RepID=UPI0032975315